MWVSPRWKAQTANLKLKSSPDWRKRSQQRTAVLSEDRWRCPMSHSGKEKSGFAGEHGGLSVRRRNVMLNPWLESRMCHLRSREASQNNFPTTAARAALIRAWAGRQRDDLSPLRSKRILSALEETPGFYAQWVGELSITQGAESRSCDTVARFRFIPRQK